MNSKKNWILVYIAIVAFLNGVATQYIEPGMVYPKTDIPFMLIGMFLSFWWYCLDSEQINYKRGKLLNVGIIAAGFLAFPYYFFRTRGIKGGIGYTSAFLVVIILWSVLQSVGAYAVYYGLKS